MTNWIEFNVRSRIRSEDELRKRRVGHHAASEVLGIVMYELGCMNDEKEAVISAELPGQPADLKDWLMTYIDEEVSGDEAPYWQPPLDAAAKLRALAAIFERRGPAATLWWEESVDGIFSELMVRARDQQLSEDNQYSGCVAGDWACHLAYCLRQSSIVLEELAAEGEKEVLLTFAPF